ncbi:MAG: replication-relaxation family protein [Dinoroseobacter sp.]|nr:replication-relaxation family protein [Dinoroseobacter sp.]
MDDQKPLSRHKREPRKLPNFKITERDVEIMRALGRYRYLSVSQIRRLFFPSSVDTQAANGRLRKLFHSGYIHKAEPYSRLAQPQSEYIYLLDKKGAEYLAKIGKAERSWRKGRDVKQAFLQHALDLSEFRINLELALSKQDVVYLDTFIPDFQMRSRAQDYASRHRYELYTELVSPINRRSYVIYPDALIILKAERNGKVHDRLLFLEIDRGTHGLEKIREKVHGYYLYHAKGLHRPILENNTDFTVLFQTSSERRADNIREILAGYIGSERVWVTDYAQVDETSILFAPIWKGVSGHPKSILKPTGLLPAPKYP